MLEDRALPPAVLGVVLSGFLTSAYLLLRKPFCSDSRGVWALPATAAVASRVGAPRAALLAYRLAAFAFAASIGTAQLARSPGVLVYYTVWSWWALTLYFGLAATASALALASPPPPLRQRGADRPAAIAPLGAAVVTLFHVVLPSSIIVVTVTWCVLFPMLASSDDPKTVANARRMFLTKTSYAQHGANAALAVGELALNAIPPTPYLFAFLGAYSSTFGVWAFAFHRATGRWLYPFLNAHKKTAPLAYAGLYIAHWAFFGVAMALFRARDAAATALVDADGGRAGGRGDGCRVKGKKV